MKQTDKRIGKWFCASFICGCLSLVSLGVQAASPLVTVGEARFSVLWFDVYDAKLSTQTGRFEGVTAPIKLELTYLRKISKAELVEQTEKQWKRLGFPSEQYQPWLAVLTQVWPDVNKGDRLAFSFPSAGQSGFTFNDEALIAPEGVNLDDDFARAFLLIWLSEETPNPDFFQQLTGQVKN
ncbi:MAG: hypothetical protein ACPGMR_03735 [Pontibacterium sp.]